MSLKCWLYEHDWETKYEFDIPLHPWDIDNSCLHDGFVFMERERCERCYTKTTASPVEITLERLEEYGGYVSESTMEEYR